jgi:hypothetical protein
MNYENRTLKELLEIATAKTHSQSSLEMQDRAIAEIGERWCRWCEDAKNYRPENNYIQTLIRFVIENRAEIKDLLQLLEENGIE